jgi:hypothetical protein
MASHSSHPDVDNYRSGQLLGTGWLARLQRQFAVASWLEETKATASQFQQQFNMNYKLKEENSREKVQIAISILTGTTLCKWQPLASRLLADQP